MKHELDVLKALTLHWSTAKPTVPGWYWWRWLEHAGTRLGYGPQVLMVEISADGEYWTPNQFALQGGQWAGPITPPED